MHEEARFSRIIVWERGTSRFPQATERCLVDSVGSRNEHVNPYCILAAAMLRPVQRREPSA